MSCGFLCSDGFFMHFFIRAEISLSVGRAGYLGEAAQVVLRALRSLGVMLGPA